jgi:hypothetical protein
MGSHDRARGAPTPRGVDGACRVVARFRAIPAEQWRQMENNRRARVADPMKAQPSPSASRPTRAGVGPADSRDAHAREVPARSTPRRRFASAAERPGRRGEVAVWTLDGRHCTPPRRVGTPSLFSLSAMAWTLLLAAGQIIAVSARPLLNWHPCLSGALIARNRIESCLIEEGQESLNPAPRAVQSVIGAKSRFACEASAPMGYDGEEVVERIRVCQLGRDSMLPQTLPHDGFPSLLALALELETAP